MQRAAIMAGGDFLVGLACLGEGVIAGESNDAMQFGIETLQAIEIDAGEALGGQRLGFDPARKLGHGGIGDGFVA